MFGTLARKVIGSRNDRILKQLRRQLGEIERHAERAGAMGDDELRGPSPWCARPPSARSGCARSMSR